MPADPQQPTTIPASAPAHRPPEPTAPDGQSTTPADDVHDRHHPRHDNQPTPAPAPAHRLPEPTGAASAIRRREEAALAGHRGDASAARRFLDDRDPGVRATALRALCRAGGLTASALTAAMGDRHHTMRSAALELAAHSGDLPATAAAALLDDEHPRVVEAAAWACGEIAGRQPRAGAENLHDTENPHDATLYGAENLHDATKAAMPPNTPTAGTATSDVIDALSRVAASHSDALCRESAVAAIGAIGDPRGLGTVLAGLEDKPAVRRRAVIALTPFDGPDVEAALARAALDRDRQVRAAATELQLHRNPPDADRNPPDADHPIPMA